MKQLTKLFLMFAGITLLTACTPNISPNSYTADSTGVAQQAQNGVIIDVRPVQVTAPNAQQTGLLAGGGAGAIAGSAIGGDWRTNLLGAIGGGLIGGFAGNEIGKHVGNQTGYQYVIKLDNGQSLAVIQGGQPLAVGQRVTVLSGGGAPARVIPS